MDLENKFISDMFGNKVLQWTSRFSVGDIQFSSVEKIFSTTCSGGDKVVVFG